MTAPGAGLDILRLGWHEKWLRSPPVPPERPTLLDYQPEPPEIVSRATAAYRADMRDRGFMLFLGALLFVGGLVGRAMLQAHIEETTSPASPSKGEITPENWLVVLLAVAGLGAVVLVYNIGKLGAAAMRHSRWKQELARRMAYGKRAIDSANSETMGQFEVSERQYQRNLDHYANLVRWWTVAADHSIDRLDVLGGTPTGWNLLLQTFSLSRLASGGEVFLVDLTQVGLGSRLLEAIESTGLDVDICVLPDDLDRIGLGEGVDRRSLLEVLANLTHITDDGHATHTWAADSQILQRIDSYFDEAPTVRQLLACARVLAGVGDPTEFIRSGLLPASVVERLTNDFSERALQGGVAGRATVIADHLAQIESFGEHPVPGHAAMQIWTLDGSGDALRIEIVRALLLSLLGNVMRRHRRLARWRRTVILCGAENVPADELDRLTKACATSNVGLMLMYEWATDEVARRLGRGDSAAVFMRMDNINDAEVASRHIGAQFELTFSQATMSAGRSTSETTGTDSSTNSSTSYNHGRDYGLNQSASETRQNRGGPGSRSGQVTHGWSHSANESWGDTRGTSFGTNQSRSLESNQSEAHTVARTRENFVEPIELQELPETAFIYSRKERGRSVVAITGDTDPAIGRTPYASDRPVPDGPSPMYELRR